MVRSRCFIPIVLRLVPHFSFSPHKLTIIFASLVSYSYNTEFTWTTNHQLTWAANHPMVGENGDTLLFDISSFSNSSYWDSFFLLIFLAIACFCGPGTEPSLFVLAGASFVLQNTKRKICYAFCLTAAIISTWPVSICGWSRTQPARSVESHCLCSITLKANTLHLLLPFLHHYPA